MTMPLANMIRPVGFGLGLSLLTPVSGCLNPIDMSENHGNDPIDPGPTDQDPCQGDNVPLGCEAEKTLPTLFKLKLTATGVDYMAPDVTPETPESDAPFLMAEQASVYLTIERDRFSTIEETNGAIRFQAIAKWASEPAMVSENEIVDAAISLRKSGASLCEVGYDILYNGLHYPTGYPFKDIAEDPFFFCHADGQAIGLFYAVDGFYDPAANTLEFTLSNTHGWAPHDIDNPSSLMSFELYSQLPEVPESVEGFPMFSVVDDPDSEDPNIKIVKLANGALFVYEPKAFTLNIAGLFTDVFEAGELEPVDSPEASLCSGAACDDLGRELANNGYPHAGGGTADGIIAELISVVYTEDDFTEPDFDPTGGTDDTGTDTDGGTDGTGTDGG